jgi:acyl-ACP thioesterase
VARIPWALRSTDVDLHGHVNNAVHWQAVEDALDASALDASAPLVAELDYRDPIDLTDRLELVVGTAGQALSIGFRVGDTVRAVARVTAPRPPASR